MFFTELGRHAKDAFEIKYWELFNEAPPLEENRCVVLAVDDEKNNKVAGFVVGQTAVHLEPLWIHPEYRHRFILMGLVTKLVEAQPGVKTAYTTTSDKNVAGILDTLSERLPKRGLHVDRMEEKIWRLRREHSNGR